MSVGDRSALAALLALAVALTLGADVVAEHGAEDEVLLGRELAERARHHASDGRHTLPLAKEEVDPSVAHGLDDVVDALLLQSVDGEVAILLVEGIEHHLSHSLLILIDMIHEHLHVGQRHHLSLFHFSLSPRFLLIGLFAMCHPAPRVTHGLPRSRLLVS